MEQGAGLTVGQEQNVNELIKNRDELLIERDKLLDELVKLRSSLEDGQQKQLELEKKFDEANNTISQVKKLIRKFTLNLFRINTMFGTRYSSKIRRFYFSLKNLQMKSKICISRLDFYFSQSKNS